MDWYAGNVTEINWRYYQESDSARRSSLGRERTFQLQQLSSCGWGNSNLPNDSSPPFTGSAFVSFKRLNSCWLRLNDGIEVSRPGPHFVGTWILSFKTKTNKNLTFWMEQKHFWVNVGELLFDKFEFTSFTGKRIVVVGRCISGCNVPSNYNNCLPLDEVIQISQTTSPRHSSDIHVFPLKRLNSC